MNPRTAINDLLPFQGSPFNHLGTSASIVLSRFYGYQITSGEGGIRTHAPFQTNGFQDRLVMTTSIPLRNVPNHSISFILFCQALFTFSFTFIVYVSEMTLAIFYYLYLSL